ncbi:MAG: hypothetical protein IJV41_09735 [Oscillospiraceae bacterium]|nr:hypothetical protein [Oscillospiraceae bacterium]
MIDPRRKIEQYCYRHPNFGIPNLMRYLTIANVVFWILGVISRPFLSYIVFDPALILRGQVWRLVSFMLYPPSTSIIAVLVFYFYYWIGSSLEAQWGTGQFTIYFFTGVILTVLYGFITYFVTGYSVRLDSSYIYLSMFFSFAVLYPDMQVLFMYIIPIKMKYLAILDALFFLYSIFTTRFPFNLLPVVAVLNFLIFCGADLWRMLPRKQSKSTVNFRRESARIRREQQDRLYTHKCAVCGRTDVEYPNLEFRYCSRCVGYHCFCADHINNHIHFTE